jgi:hypothetical protein
MIRSVLATDDRGRLRTAIEKTLDQAADGSLPHLDWLATRIDGKAMAQVEVSATGTLQDALRRIAMQPVPDALPTTITIEHDEAQA